MTMIVMRRICTVLGLLLVVPLLGACGHGPRVSSRPLVVTSFYPLQWVAERVAGRHAEVVDLTHPGQEPHDIELTVRQTADVVDASVVLYARGLQAAVDGAVDRETPRHVVDATAVARPVGDDPHFWLDPTRLSAVAAAFERRLAGVDPAHAPDYARRLRRLQADLTGLDRSFHRGLAHCRIHTIVVSHDAFGYLGRRYGLHVAGIDGLSPDAEPSPAHVRALQDLIRRGHLTTVFSEELASRDLADSIAGDLGLRSAVLDPVEGLDDATAGQDYLSLMRRNLTTLRKANRCS